VKRATVSGGPYTTIATPTATSYINTGLTNGTTYYYVVTAANSGGESAPSSEVNATPQSASNPPAPPSGLSARPTGPRKIKLNWTQSPSPGITANGIYRRTSNGTYPSTPTLTINPATSYQDTGRVGGTTYCYVISAFNGSLESAKSNESCATAK
jgi:fibronectin type 3 domain-containing protein